SGELCLGRIIPWLQSRLRLDDGGLWLDSRQSSADKCYCFARIWGTALLDLLGLSESARRFHSATGPGTAYCQHSTTGRLVVTALPGCTGGSRRDRSCIAGG